MAELTIQQAFEIASRQYQSGQTQDAEALYRQILGYQPNHTPTMQMLAQLAHQRGQVGEAEELLCRAISVNPQDADAHNNLGMVLTTEGRFDDAVNSYGRALVLRPAFPEAYNNLGNTLRASGQLAQAIRSYQKALSFRPDYSDARDNLADAQKEQEHREREQAAAKVEPEPTIEVPDELLVGIEAASIHEEAPAKLPAEETIEPQPAALEPERPIEAVEAPKVQLEASELAAEEEPKPLEVPAVAAEPESIPVGLEPEAEQVETFELAESVSADEPVEISAEPRSAESEAQEAGESELEPVEVAAEAEPAEEEKIAPQKHIEEPQVLEEAAALEEPEAMEEPQEPAEPAPVEEAPPKVEEPAEFVPQTADEFKQRARSRWGRGRYDEAAADFHAALDVDPSDAEARTDLGLILLAQGDFRQGWPAYEAKLAERWPVSALPQPAWDGSDLANHRILLRAEQGVTDAIQFIRYAPLVAKRGGRVIVRCRPELRNLLVDQPGILLLVSTSEPMPKFFTHCPIASLPRVMGTTPQEIPADVPYLLADGKLVDKWYARISAEPAGLKVGVALRSEPGTTSNEEVTSPASALGPLGELSGARFYALQSPKEEGAPSVPSELEPTDWTRELSDLAQTAALISCLDLVITTDNVVAHLAGALGRLTLLLLPFVADWRWMIGRGDSPWYPTMRLFRQPEPGDWESPARQVIEELRRRV